MNKRKIFNDPVYGFITIPSDIIFDLIQHPYVQRLRRISQLGLTHLTYPGALHTRFHHALGALHLMTLTIDQLKQKGTVISAEEEEAVYIAILLHDIGHGPFSHALEHLLIDVDHEELSLALMHELNQQFEGRLTVAIEVFTNRHHKRFLHQLISGQLDMDRLDYLTRDSFYTGVMEGKVGYDRIIKMLRVIDDQLVVEEKGIYSIEKFLVARKIMYWQVYLHKTVLSAELMLKAAVKRAQELYLQGAAIQLSKSLTTIFQSSWSNKDQRDDLLSAFVSLDDVDILALLKNALYCSDFQLHLLADGLINRNLFRVELSVIPFKSKDVDLIKEEVATHLEIDINLMDELVFTGIEQTETYDFQESEIKLLNKKGEVVPLTSFQLGPFSSSVAKYYVCYPKLTNTAF
ncbi:MAG: HD domain-containing protein [Saprospiraceae bacterium]|nr:HD domain-containing protein [Saprospiraceae bacterium]